MYVYIYIIFIYGCIVNLGDSCEKHILHCLDWCHIVTPLECLHQELFGVHFSELLNTSCDKDFQQRWVRWGDGRVGQSDCFFDQ